MVFISSFNTKYLHQYIAVMAGAFIFFVVGNEIGAMSPYYEKLTMEGYNNIGKISDTSRSLLISLQVLGILPGGIIVLYANDILGRKYSMLVMNIPAILSSIFVYFAINTTMIYIVAILRGMVCAWSYSVVPTFVSEIASPHLRGPLTVFCTFIMTIGNFCGSLEQASLSIETTAIIDSVAILLSFIILLVFVTETPYYFITKNQDDKCKESLRKYLRQQNVDREYEEIRTAWNESVKAKQVGCVKVFTVPSYIKVLLICVGVLTVQQFTGHIIMNTNIHNIVKNSGLHLSMPQISLIVNGVNCIACILSIFIIDSWGRRPLFMIVSAGACLGHFIAGLGFFLQNSKSETSNALGITILIGNVIYLAMVGLGLMHLPNVLAAELFPTDIKSKCCSLLLIIASIEGIIASQSFDLLSKIAYYIPFWAMSGWALLGLIFGIIWIPETKNKSLTEIQIQLNLLSTKLVKIADIV